MKTLDMRMTAAVTWFFRSLFMDAVAPAWVVLATLLLLALMTAFLGWVRRMPGDVRRRGFKQGLLAGLFLGLAVMANSWHRGQLQDALLFFPISLILVTILLAAPFGLAWHLSSLITPHDEARRKDDDQRSVAAAPWLAVLVAATLFIFCVGPWMQALTLVDLARGTSMKHRGRGIWIAIVSGSNLRGESGLPELWPRELGFTWEESSTYYFRRLMSDVAEGFSTLVSRHSTSACCSRRRLRLQVWQPPQWSTASCVRDFEIVLIRLWFFPMPPVRPFPACG